MATGLSSPLGFAGVLMIIIGIILAVAGVIALVAMANESKPWWTWFLLIGGIVIGIIGGILLAIAFSSMPVIATAVVPATPVVVSTPPVACAAPPAQQVVYTPPPQPVACAAPPAQQIVYTSPPQPMVYAPPLQPVVYAQPQQQPVVYAQPQQQQQVVATPPVVPIDSVSTRQYAVGPAHFNPDSLTYRTYTPGTQTRIVAEGNYGPAGERTQVPGVLTTPATLTETNYDVGDHPVIVQPSQQTVVNRAPVMAQPVQYYQAPPRVVTQPQASPRYVTQQVVAQPQGQVVLTR